MKTPKIILEQIDKAVNPDRDLGKVRLSKPIVLSYREQEDKENPNLVDVGWKKRYYSYDRGQFYPLDIHSFTGFFGKIYITTVSSQFGNFVDFIDFENSNIHYSTEVYVRNPVNVSLYVGVTYGSVSIYVNQNEQVKSSTQTYYIPSKHVLNLIKGWNTIDIFVYHENEDTKITVENDLSKRIDSFRFPDFEPPTAPSWRSTNPIVCNYIEPTKSPALQNTLFWINDAYNNPQSSLAGWGMYQRITQSRITDSDGNYIRAVSGWDSNYAFVVSNDKRGYFPANIEVSLEPISGNYTISGTSYRSDLLQTIVGLTTQIVSSPNNNLINKHVYQHLSDINFDSSLGYIVSGTHKNVNSNQSYWYFLDAFDNSINKNRSEKSSVSYIVAQDSTVPHRIPSSAIQEIKSGFKSLSVTITNPANWDDYDVNPEYDIRRYRVWTIENPTTPQKIYCVNEFNVTYDDTEIEQTFVINRTRDGSGNLAVLSDKTEYTFYLSTVDWYGNEYLTDLTAITGTTNVKINTNPGNIRIELDSDLNALRMYANV